MTDHYSQLGQDKWILEEVYPDTKGVFVEIGAGDGVRLSNTKALEEAGWNGLCVEPSRYGARDFINNRLSTKLDIRCVYDGSLVTFREMIPEDDFYPQTSGITSNLEEQGKWNKFHEREVPSVKLHDLLDDWCMPEFIHYLSIDVEGAEIDVLRNFDFSKYKFGAITIEHNYRTQDRVPILAIMKNHGYKLYEERKWDFFFLENRK